MFPVLLVLPASAIGCGDGSLLVHLLRNAAFTSLTSITGIDTSSTALHNAGKRLDNTVHKSPAMSYGTTPLTFTTAAGVGGSVGLAGPSGGERAAGGSAATAAEAPAGPTDDNGTYEMAGGAGDGGGGVAGLGPMVGRVGSTAASSFGETPAIVVSAGGGNGGEGGSVGRTSSQATAGSIIETTPATAHISSAVGQASSWSSSISLIEADFTSPHLTVPAGWGSLVGCDLVVCSEVVQKLNPEKLALVGPTLLGGLQPAAAVVTTPNWDYNQVLRKLNSRGGPWPGPAGRDGLPLRSAEHKFEWSREEFRCWADGLAVAYGYEVVFEDVGRAVREVEVMGGGEGELGGASQAAIFRRVERGSPDRGQEVGEMVWGPREVVVEVGGLGGSGREGEEDVSQMEVSIAGEHL